MADPLAIERAIKFAPIKVSSFDTKLSPEDEKRFGDWLKKESIKRSRDVGMDTTDYDLRGFWQDGGADSSGTGHMPDTYKKPNHPTFSDESKYHGADMGNGQIALGGKWDGDSVFIPGPTNLQTHGMQGLREYFRRYEPGVILIQKGN